MTRTVDLHQHAWPERFLAALSARTTAPCTRREDDGRWTLLLPGEPACTLGEAETDLHRRAGGLHAAGIDHALLVPPLAIGVDALPADEARALLAVWLDAALDAGPAFGAWGAIPAADPRPSDVHAALRRGAVGLAVAAGDLADAAALDRIGPVLEALEAADRPLFVHPGAVPAGAGVDAAAWWPSVADYPGQLLRAWATWLDRGIEAFPRLRVGFAALAGGGPLLLERLAARGGPVEAAASDRIFYESSSFGPEALGQAARAVGADRLVFGSDRPVVDPRLQHAPVVPGVDPASFVGDAAARLLGPAAIAAAPVPVGPVAVPAVAEHPRPVLVKEAA